MKRQLGAPAVFAICSGAMFSSGFFLLPGLAAEETGPSLPLVYLTASFLMLPAIFSMAELSSAMPRAGGPYFFLNRSMGPLIGLVGAFGKYLQMVLKGAFAFVGVGVYLSLVLDVSIKPIAVGLIIGFTLLNLVGSRQTARTEILLVSLLLILLTYFLISGVTQLVWETLDISQEFQPLFPLGIEGFVSAIALVFVSFGGIGQVASVSEEIRKPSRSMPRGMLMALAVALFFYLLGTSIMVLLLPAESLQGDNAPVATAAQHFARLPLPTLVIVIAALAGFASAGNAAIFSATRYPLALARDRLIWSGFGRLDSRGVPRTSVLVTGGLLVVLVLVFDVKGIAKMASAFLLFVFMGMCLAVIIFRQSRIEEYKPGFRSPLYPWMQITGIVVYLSLIWWSGFKAIGFILAMCVIALLWYRFGVKTKTGSSAAIYSLFGRMAKKSPQYFIEGELGLPMLGSTHLAHLVERAIIFDLKKESDFDQVIQKAADALRDRLGGHREALAEQLKEEIRHWATPLRSDVAVAPVLLGGIEQPEMVIIRGSIHLDDKELHGLIVLVDDEQASSRLHRFLSQLDTVIFHSNFPAIWKEAKDRNGLKDALKQDVKTVQTLTIKVEESGPTASLRGKAIKEVDLPRGSLMVLIQRNGKIRVPEGETTIKPGDELTLVAEGETMKELSKRFKQGL